jgi:hypothetical protein
MSGKTDFDKESAWRTKFLRNSATKKGRVAEIGTIFDGWEAGAGRWCAELRKKERLANEISSKFRYEEGL